MANATCSTTRHALLIGCPGPQSVPEARLPGVRQDLDAITRALERWGFECEELFDDRATRSEILRTLEQRIERTKAGHTVVIYFCGHGGRARLHSDGPAWNYLVTTDHRRSEFRGVAEIELTDCLRRLCEKTRNVTAIFDCCHAATMCRDKARRPERARTIDPTELPRPSPGIADSNLRTYAASALPASLRERLLRAPVDFAPQAEHNRDLVLLVATAADSSAYEFQEFDAARGTSHYRGYFTSELCTALEHARTMPIAWDAIIERVRQQIVWARRSTTQRPEVIGPRARLPFSLETVGDVRDHFRIVTDEHGTAWLGAGRLCGLEVGDRLALHNASGDNTGLAVVETLYESSARLELPSPRSLGRDDPGIAVAMDSHADDVARAKQLDRLLCRGPGLGKIEVTVKAWVEHADQRQRLGGHDRVHVGSYLWAEVRHTTANRPPIYLNAIGIGVDGKANLINQAEPAGIEIRALRSGWIGRQAGGRGSLRIKWPAELPRHAPRRGALLLVASRRPLDLRRLCEDPYGDDASPDLRSSSVPHDFGADLMWAVTRFELEVVP